MDDTEQSVTVFDAYGQSTVIEEETRLSKITPDEPKPAQVSTP